MIQELPSLRPIHPFPARMAPTIVWEELMTGALVPRPVLRVLDPMAGSGTTIAMARLLGHEAAGFDTDPLAVLIARAWSASVDPAQLRDAATEVVQTARSIAREVAVRDAYPAGADEETRHFVRYWFDDTSRRHLTALSTAIRALRDDALVPFLWCALSRLIIVKSMGASLAMDVAHSRPHKVYEKAPLKPLRHFERAAAVVAKHCSFMVDTRCPPAVMQEGDARKLPLGDGAVDLIITSPPYLNAIDYLRGHKFSLVWMGYSVADLRKIRATNVGTEVAAGVNNGDLYIAEALKCMGDIHRLNAREINILRRYLIDMNSVIKEMARVLTPSGRVVLVVGDSTLRQVFVQNSKALEYLGTRHDLSLVGSRYRPLPSNRRYLPPPSAEGAGKKLGICLPRHRLQEEFSLWTHVGTGQPPA